MAKVNAILFTALILVNYFIQQCNGTRSVSVCPGEQVTVTCNTNGSFLQWIIIPAGADMGTGFNIPIYETGDVSTPHVKVDQADFRFTKTSISPLESLVVIDNVTSSLNGARLNCTHTGGIIVTSTVVNVIENETITDTSVVINKYYGTENVTANIEFEAQEHVSYITTVTPDNGVAIYMTVSDVTTLNLTVSYNIRYEVSIMATLCQHNSFKNFELHYVKCEYPLKLPSVTPTNLSEPALAGTNVTITCLNKEEGAKLTSNTTITCMDNGRWEPEPSYGCDGYAERPAAGPLGLIIGVPLALVLLVLVAVIVAAILIISKGKKCTSKSKCVSIDAYQLDLETVSRPSVTNAEIHQQIGSSEYSLLQHCPLQNKRFQLQDTRGAPTTSKPGKLVYADVGPSFDRRAPNCPNTFGENKVEYASINIKSLSQAQENGQSVSRAQANTADFDDGLNLDQLLIQLKPEVTSNWYQFGEAVGVEKSLMDKWIQYPPEQNLIEVCDHWLRNHGGKPTWREVAEALKQITFKQLAFQIEKVYETGKLPKDVHVNDDAINNDSESPPPIPPRLL